VQKGEGLTIKLKQFQGVIRKLNDVVEKASPDSALEGLRTVAAAFGCLLDVYASPNPNNPDGMCDDKVAFRKMFAEIIVNGSDQSTAAAAGKAKR
jgi:hypothetical protein